MKLVHTFDAYCGWWYGFASTLAELVRRHPGLDVEVVFGGLFTGSRRVPVREFGYVQGANAKISELTGVDFGAGYERLIADGPSCIRVASLIWMPASYRANLRRLLEPVLKPSRCRGRTDARRPTLSHMALVAPWIHVVYRCENP